jgi:hypothetical protein
MKRLWNAEWQNIKFNELDVNLSFFKRASPEFYSIFYDKLFNLYGSFDDLPSDWKEEKINTTKQISLLVGHEDLILSYGCGLGFIEKELAYTYNIKNIDAFDFAKTASKWIKGFDKVKCINNLEDKKKYDFIYSCQLLYALSNKELNDFILLIKENINVNGKFLTINTSSSTIENGARPISVSNKIKNFIRPIFWFLLRRDIYQFWGWERNNSELLKIFKKNGFHLSKSFSAEKQSFLLFELDS